MRKDHYARFDGIVLFTRKYKEKDLLIKIFTKEFGKRMFFIKNIQRQNNGLREIAFPYMRASFVGTINDNGCIHMHAVQFIFLHGVYLNSNWMWDFFICI